jgi:hypothetical protein
VLVPVVATVGAEHPGSCQGPDHGNVLGGVLVVSGERRAQVRVGRAVVTGER